MDKTKKHAEVPQASVDTSQTGRSGGVTESTNGPSVGDQCLETENLTEKGQSNPKKTSFLQRLRNHMAAVAYAEAGEYQSAKELLEPVPRSKAVLLVIEGEAPDAASSSHALSLCARTGGDLDVLQVIPLIGGESHDERLRDEMTHAFGPLASLVRQAHEARVPIKITVRQGEVSEKLFDYAKRHKEVAMVILDSPRVRAGLSKDKVWARFVESISQQLSLPLVTVMPKDPAPA